MVHVIYSMFEGIQYCMNFLSNPSYLVRNDMDVNEHEILYTSCSTRGIRRVTRVKNG